MFDFKKIASCTALIITAICFFIVFKDDYNGYEIVVNNQVVGYVKKIEDFEKIKNDYYTNLSKNYSGYKYNDNIYLSRERIAPSCFQSPGVIKDNMNKCTKSLIKAVIIKYNNKQAGIVESTNKLQEISYNIADRYIKKNGYLNTANLSQCVLHGNVTYSYEYVQPYEIDSLKNIEDRFWTAVDSSKLLSVSCKFNQNTDESVDFTKNIQYSSDIAKGKTVTKQQGQNGCSHVLHEIVISSSKVTQNKVIKQDTYKAPVNEIIVYGTKESPKAGTVVKVAAQPKTAVQGAAAVSVPVKGYISSFFGMRWGRMHEGIDIAANTGEPIYAYDDGIVEYAAWEEGYGNFVILKHNSNFETCYGHCSKFAVKQGDSVKKGQIIAYVGSTGNSTGPHTHFEVRVNGKTQNPMDYLK